MRKLGHGQSIMFFAPPEVDRSIRDVSKKGIAEDIHASDILVWAMTETCSDIQRRAAQWRQHGMDHKYRHSSWSSFLSSHITPDELALTWLQPEAKCLEELYAPAQTSDSGSQAVADGELWERCNSLGLCTLPDNRLDEGQEREVAQEIERECEVERPPQLPAKTHRIDEDVRSFIRAGCIPKGSRSFTAIFDTLATTSATSSSSQPWTRDVLASRDFTTTVRLGSTDKAGSYIRPVN
jgi:hypothetical protein